MKPSLFLTIFSLATNLVYGFSASPTPILATSRSNNDKMPPYSRFSGNNGLPVARSQPLDGDKRTHARTGRPLFQTADSVRGGAASSSEASSISVPLLLSSLYGAGGVVYILLKAVKRVVPIALEPFTEGGVPLTTFQLVAYITTVAWFAYVEGYKGFQTKFSPLVVSRSLTLGSSFSWTKIHHYLLAPLYSMGLFHAQRKRVIVSWSVTLGVAGIVHAVKKLPYPWRNIVDAGVVAGLTWGSLSIVLQYVKALWTGQSPADPVLPKKKE